MSSEQKELTFIRKEHWASKVVRLVEKSDTAVLNFLKEYRETDNIVGGLNRSQNVGQETRG